MALYWALPDSSRQPRTIFKSRSTSVVSDAVHEVTLQGDILVAFDQPLKASGWPSYLQVSPEDLNTRELFGWAVSGPVTTVSSPTAKLLSYYQCCHLIWLIPYPISFFSRDTLGALLNGLFVYVALISANNDTTPFLLSYVPAGAGADSFPNGPRVAQSSPATHQAPCQDNSSLHPCPLKLRGNTFW